MQPSSGVKEAMLRFCDRFTANDAGRFDQLVSAEQASMVIRTAPQEWLDDREQWRAAFGMEGVRLEAGDVRAWEEGPVGWLADRPRFVFPDGTAVPTRLTAVLRREAGGWRLVQAHFSVGIPDEKLVEVLEVGSSSSAAPA